MGPLLAALQPAEVLEFLKGFPHADETNATTCRIEDRVGQLPSHGLLAFDAVGFLQRGYIEPSFRLLALANNARAVADQAIHQCDLRAVNRTLHQVRLGHIFRYKDVCFDSRGGAIRGQRSCGISRRRNCQLLQPVVLRHGDGQAQPARLK